MTDKSLPFAVRAGHQAAGLLERPLSLLLPDRHVKVPGVDGTIYLNLGESRMMIQRALRVYEYWTAAFMRRFLRPGMTAIDVGANKGDYSLLFARMVGPTGRVLSIEPDPRNADWLQKTLAANGHDWVEIVRYALSDQPGKAVFYPGLKSGWGSLQSDRSGSTKRSPFEVPTMTLDDLLIERGSRKVDLLKVDVEGGEFAVLKGCQRLFAENDEVVLIMDVDVKTTEQKDGLSQLLQQSFGLSVWSLGRDLDPVTDLSGCTTIVASRRVSLIDSERDAVSRDR